jgi:pimeloyl-ACP methyl ester carboxylesterase
MLKTVIRRNFVKYLGATTAAALLLSQRPLFANAASEQVQSSQSSQKNGKGVNVLLAHGAFADASSWSSVIQLLQSQGYNTLAVQLPLTTQEEDIDITSQALTTLTGPTILVGHSYGGSVITNAVGNASNVVALVYIAAFAPEQGESINAIQAPFSAPPLAQHVVPSYRKGYVWVDPAAFPQIIAQDIQPEVARELAVVQKPIAPESFAALSGEPAWKKIPSWFLVAANDHAINPDAERFMAKRIKATIREIPSSHLSPVAHPNAVFDMIVSATPKAQR